MNDIMTKEEQDSFDSMIKLWVKQQELAEQGKAHTREHQEAINEFLNTIDFDKD